MREKGEGRGCLSDESERFARPVSHWSLGEVRQLIDPSITLILPLPVPPYTRLETARDCALPPVSLCHALESAGSARASLSRRRRMKLPTSLLPLVALILSSAPAPSSASSVSPGLSQAKPGSKLAKNVLTSTSERGYCSVRPPLRRASSSVILPSIGECSITISSPHASDPRPKVHLHKTLKTY